MTADLLIARHGLAHCNVAGIVGGPRSCTGLTDRGRVQAAALGSALAGLARPVTALRHSPRRRAAETAGLVGAALGLRLVEDPRLRDPDLGAGTDGMRWADLRAVLGLGRAEYAARGPGAGAEPWPAYLDRVAAALADALAAGGRVLVVGHTETVLAAHQLATGADPARPPPDGPVTAHATVSWWRRHGDRMTLMGHNVPVRALDGHSQA